MRSMEIVFRDLGLVFMWTSTWFQRAMEREQQLTKQRDGLYDLLQRLRGESLGG